MLTKSGASWRQHHSPDICCTPIAFSASAQSSVVHAVVVRRGRALGCTPACFRKAGWIGAPAGRSLVDEHPAPRLRCALGGPRTRMRLCEEMYNK